MFRVGIIGSENSHALAFSRIFNLSGKYEDIKVVAVWGEDMEASEKIKAECGVDIVKPEAMLGMVDAVMVTSRNGALHAGYARPFIEAGKPAFIDKPIANDAGEAAALIDLAFEKHVPVMGGSSLKLVAGTLAAREFAQARKAEGELIGGYVFAPVSMDNPYGGFYFYAAHLVETALTIFGYDPIAVTAVRTKAGISCALEYAAFGVSLQFTDGVYNYGATVLGKNGADMRLITLDDAYDREVAHFAKMLRTGEVPQSAHDIVMPVRVLNAIEQSYETGARCAIK
ncbi:MAG: Gfo/Idh/MocA family oxidoreductase [Clostridia bacterium]|nr:Gfo/Idh/MocA family oxidoreductase [Clostridia bacterium]